MYYLVLDFSYERSLGSDCSDIIEGVFETFEDAEQVLDSYDSYSSCHMYITSEDDFHN